MLSKKDIHWLSVYQKQHPQGKGDVRLSARALYQAGLSSVKIAKMLGIFWSIQVLRWCTKQERIDHDNNREFKTPKNIRIRCSTEYGFWRSAVFSRDSWTCVDCGYHGRDMHVHHMKPFATFPKERFSVENGKTLCKQCHASYHPKVKCIS